MGNFVLPHEHGENGNIESLHGQLIQKDNFSVVAEIFKQLSDSTRIRIFWLLCHREECVINIAAILEMSSPAVSHHLRTLYDCGLISSRRDGKEVYYRASDTQESQLLHKTVEQVMEITCPKELEKRQSTPEEMIQDIHDFLMEHIAERITIEELSKKFLMNSTTLKKAFKNVYGIPIAAHMKIHRMEMAAKLLSETNDSIAQIALAVGYESQSRFTAAFKDTFHLLPTEYRRKNVTVHPMTNHVADWSWKKE